MAIDWQVKLGLASCRRFAQMLFDDKSVRCRAASARQCFPPSNVGQLDQPPSTEALQGVRHFQSRNQTIQTKGRGQARNHLAAHQISSVWTSGVQGEQQL